MAGRPPKGTYLPLPPNPFPDFLDDIAGPNAQLSLTYTYANGSYSCSWHAYMVHMYMNIVIYYVGILCFLVRVVPQLKWMHAFLGRVYVAAMILTIASSLLISTTGLPLFVLSSFFWTLSGMILGWFIIKLHQNQMLNLAFGMVDTWIKEGRLGGSLSDAVADAMGQIGRSKTWVQRFVSYKAAHGILMTMSWFPIAGRFWASDVTNEFVCWTYPVYKAVSTTIGETANEGWGDVTLEERLLPEMRGSPVPSDRFPGGELGWFLFGGLRPLVIGTLIGVGFSVWAARREKTRVAAESSVQLQSDATWTAG